MTLTTTHVVLPLGTGNDLARVLQWGGGYDGESLVAILKQVEAAVPVPLDRWQLNFYDWDSLTNKTGTKVINNYFSVGADAAIALDFHHKRESSPELFTSRFVNRMWYAYYGGKAIVGPEVPINNMLEMEVDGDVVSIPNSIVGLIFLNLNSYSGGARLWGSTLTSEEKQKGYKQSTINDGLLEVCGIKGAFEMGAFTQGVGLPLKIAQGRSFLLRCKMDSIPMQVDGEPWAQKGPCFIKVSLFNQAQMLFKKK